MSIYKSKNPALGLEVFSKAAKEEATETMTIQGTVNKTALMGLIVFVGSVL